MQEAVWLLKQAIELISAVLFAGILKIMRPRPRRVVLYYHGLKQKQLAAFERQMAHLARRYTVVPASRIKIARSEHGKSLVALTFDDGLASVLNHAVPILKRFALPASICVPTGNLGRRPAWEMADDCPDRDDCVMTTRQVKELDKSGFELFSHGVSHVPLSQLPTDEICSEVTESKKHLERIVGHEITGISYPHGAYDSRVIRLAREAGYHVAFTTQPHLVDDKTETLEIGRTSVSPDDGLLVFKLKACGAYQASLYLRMCKRVVLGRHRHV